MGVCIVGCEVVRKRLFVDFSRSGKSSFFRALAQKILNEAFAPAAALVKDLRQLRRFRLAGFAHCGMLGGALSAKERHEKEVPHVLTGSYR